MRRPLNGNDDGPKLIRYDLRGLANNPLQLSKTTTIAK